MVFAWAATLFFFLDFDAGLEERLARVALAALLPVFARVFLADAGLRTAADPDLRVAVFLRAAVALARVAGLLRAAVLRFAAALPDFEPDFFAGITDSCPVIKGAPDYSHRTAAVQQSQPAFGPGFPKDLQIGSRQLPERSNFGFYGNRLLGAQGSGTGAFGDQSAARCSATTVV
ncbi:MAG: hypothetical protein AMJ58_05725 [Gammaproteobacteria bacterium SG8_30]|nr:MAG: hypothetical protein AMJ58_05725 [Gammaproteobacteria bacterium SG8_30]